MAVDGMLKDERSAALVKKTGSLIRSMCDVMAGNG
jgi:hypothetical protein